MKKNTPSQEQIDTMRKTLAVNGFESFLRHLSACYKNSHSNAVRMISGATGAVEVTVRKWKKTGVTNEHAAKALCELARTHGFYFGLHMLRPTDAVCVAWIDRDDRVLVEKYAA
ncbi:hypothetical protein [Enterovibrio sp. 27052020O]|uniref:hypothetical protein n=1 Tax=Enterovibrio sp. 27052020O TaxID=3241166 RepID=UPI00388EC558